MSLNTYKDSSISRRRTCWENDLPAELIKDLKIPVDQYAKVADFLARDLQQFGSNLKAKLLAECEIHLARERREFLEEVDACVEQKVLAYRHEVCADEQQTVLEQRKKLQERLVVQAFFF